MIVKSGLTLLLPGISVTQHPHRNNYTIGTSDRFLDSKSPLAYPDDISRDAHEFSNYMNFMSIYIYSFIILQCLMFVKYLPL